MPYTNETHSTMVAAALADWSTMGNTARLSSDPRAGLAAWMLAAQDGICAFCGDAAIQPEVCHIVPGGRERKGWIAGNLAIGCRECNELDGGNLVEFNSIKRADLIQMTWPERTELARIGKAEKVAKEKAREAKRIQRGM